MGTFNGVQSMRKTGIRINRYELSLIVQSTDPRAEIRKLQKKYRLPCNAALDMTTREFIKL